VSFGDAPGSWMRFLPAGQKSWWRQEPVLAKAHCSTDWLHIRERTIMSMRTIETRTELLIVAPDWQLKEGR